MYNIFNTDLICPECGEGHMVREEPKVIKSNTETYTYLCPDCGFVHTAKSDEDMREWIKSLDKPIEEEKNQWGLAMMDAVGEACKKEMENWSSEELEQAKENLKKSIDRAVEIGNTKHHIKGGTDYHAKQDYGKRKLSLVPREIIWAVAAIREYGNNKYPDGGSDNWRSVEPERYRDAAYRHFLRYLDDPKSVDSESGLPHLWHLACNIAFLCEMQKEDFENIP